MPAQVPRAELANGVNRAIHQLKPREELDSLMAELIQFTGVHCKTEEDWMQAQGYPDLEAHKREHRWLLNKLQYLGGGSEQWREMLILQTIKDWLIQHIDIEDKNIARMVRR